MQRTSTFLIAMGLLVIHDRWYHVQYLKQLTPLVQVWMDVIVCDKDQLCRITLTAAVGDFRDSLEVQDLESMICCMSGL